MKQYISIVLVAAAIIWTIGLESIKPKGYTIKLKEEAYISGEADD